MFPPGAPFLLKARPRVLNFPILPRVRDDPMWNWFYYFIGIVSWPMLRILFRLRASGMERVPATGGFVLAANHTSNFDPWPLGYPLWPRRRLRWMAKSELFNWILSPILRHGGAFPVRRGMNDRRAVETAIELARAGDIVVMFPEGTRRRKGLRKKFRPQAHTGSARIALNAGVPLVPAAIVGTDRLARLGPLRVLYGEPIPMEDLDGHDPGTAAEIATERLMQRIDELEQRLREGARG
jgi:1-acyl-sn-glycerol-3-phosphate acyltransferase